MATYGIDEKVSDLSDTYRNNPRGLQDKYRMSGDLVDLIALQRINEERKAKQKEIAMQMEQNPQSVAEQEYEQAKGLIKDDIVGQTGKLLQEKQKRAAMNQQRMMGGQPPTGVPAAARRRPPTNIAGIGGIPPRAPVNPRGTGIAANPVPSSPTAYGAGGGIVSFAKGDKVRLSGEEILASIGHTPESFRELPEARRAELIKHLNTQRAVQRPDIFTRAGAAAGDLFFGALGAPFNLLGDAARGSGIVHPDTKFFGEYDPLLLSKAAQARADDPNLQPLRPADLRRHDIGAITPQVQPHPPIPQVPPTSVLGEVEDQFTGVPPTVTAQGMLRDFVERSGRDFTKEGFVPAPDFPVESEDATTVSAYTIDQADPERAKLLRDKRGTLQTDVEGIAGQDVAQAWRDKVTAGENVFGREGVAGKFDSMVNERRNLYDAEGASRADSRLWDILARTGGQGAFADAGRAASDIREADRQRRVMELADVQGLQERGIAQDYSMANAILTSADKTETNVTNAIANANTVRESILNSESSELTDLARNMMDADIQNMEQEDRVLQRKFDAMISKYGQQVTQRGQNLTAQLANERNAIAALNVVAMTEVERDKLIVKIEDLVRKISTDYTVVAQDAINALKIEEVYTKAEPADQKRMEDEIKEEYGKLADIIAEQFRNALEEVWGAGYKVSK